MKTLLVVLAAIYLLGGLDDFFMDAVYYISVLYRRITGKDPQRVNEDMMHNTKQQRIAILVPAWDESAVIARMLESSIHLLDYANFDIFVGTYPNDPDTQIEVERMGVRFPNIHSVVTPNDGPTSKADCLNWIVEGIRLYEKHHKTHFDIFVMQDAEDFVHPLSLKLYNCLIPAHDMVQTPVIPFEQPWYSFISNSYLDEFAESHLKTLCARQIVGGMVPSAGVGTAFSRSACDQLAEQTNHQLFNPLSLTEDYDFGFRLYELGRKSIISNTWVERVQTRQKKGETSQHLKAVSELMATREYFPTKFSQAIRQKCRWNTGIVFQGWEFIGWKGSLRKKYMLYRDRKGLVTAYLNILSYTLALAALFLWLGSEAITHGQHPYSLLAPPHLSIWPWLFYANLALLANRLVQRGVSVYRVTNLQQALLSIPRLMVSNVVDLTATVMATRRYVSSRITGKPLSWAKTAHAFPSEEILLGQKRKLGDLLLERRLITPPDLLHALEQQMMTGNKLGEILVERGQITNTQLEEMLALQMNAAPTLEMRPQEGDEVSATESHKTSHDDNPLKNGESVIPMGMEAAK